MALRTIRIDGDDPLASLDTGDLTAMGAASGLLWKSPRMVLAGLGIHERIQLGRPDGGAVAQSRLAELGGVAFAALPFDPVADGELLVPEILIRASTTGDERSLIVADRISDDLARSSIAETLASPSDDLPTNITIRSTIAPDVWRDDVVGRAIDELDRRGMRKAVLARELVLVADGDFDRASIVRSLARRFPIANIFSIDRFVGASPELLVARTDRTVRAHPLAGTAPRRSDETADAAEIAELRSSTKDQTEHRITIDWLLSELLPFCSYVDAEPEPSVMTLANVHHLATIVEGVLSEPAASILDLVGAVHPTPAVGGAPQSGALELIGELERMERGRYAGPTGWVDAEGNGEFAVGVRTAQIDGPEARVWAGVGVVAASDPDAELRETRAKFRAMLGSILP